MSPKLAHYLFQAVLLFIAIILCEFVWLGIPALQHQQKKLLGAMPAPVITTFLQEHSGKLASFLICAYLANVAALWKARKDLVSLTSIALLYGLFMVGVILVIAIGMIAPMNDFSFR